MIVKNHLTTVVLPIAGGFVLALLLFAASRAFTNEPTITAQTKQVDLKRGPSMVDPVRPENWGLTQINTQDAWNLSKGDDEIIVAIIDTGADVNHPKLANNIWTNPGECGSDMFGRDKSTNGVDDDGNGFIDDIHGWNFASDDDDVTDRQGHGTHIAGIISGVAPKVSLMILKYYDPQAPDLNPLASTLKAIHYASKMGAKVINYSGGGVQSSQLEREAIREAGKLGILFVAAAGNEKNNSDLKPYYPADYGLTNILSVTAIDQDETILPSSNWGRSSVDLAAPGKDILSTLPGGRYGYLTGTSQATAFATGTAVLVMAARDDLLDPERLIRHLVNTGDAQSGLEGRTKNRSILNSYRALAIRSRSAGLSGAEADNVTRENDLAFTLGDAGQR